MINWNQIETVLLDMDGTLLDLHFDNYFWLTHLPMRYADAKGISLEESERFLGERIESYRGTLQWYCLDHWSELVEMDIPLLKREILHKIQIRPYAEEFLKTLRHIGKKVVLITNSHPKGLQLKLDVTEIDRWLDLVISSHEFSLPKEDIAFWHKLQEKEHFDPNTTLFIDDTPNILRSAKTFGIQHLVCITQPDSQRRGIASGEFIDITHFDEIMPPTHVQP
ncbi:GMP/IMP nucleotidase [Teredinibacter waterburyi]|jgi:haloacid dehalogenase superfamily, subfamily IA, variant 3 with third motif having DD or ED|uniref:GMP/IMP nucleotidase n=1 Tax=Teredinibacter waterburyi TaxID=1500538 RepID=UPI00165F3EB6|nr:GMP/IMP nucleotidase [Teredinibacter waterburyi]